MKTQTSVSLKEVSDSTQELVNLKESQGDFWDTAGDLVIQIR